MAQLIKNAGICARPSAPKFLDRHRRGLSDDNLRNLYVKALEARARNLKWEDHLKTVEVSMRARALEF